MQITKDFRKYAIELGIAEEKALKKGMAETIGEFTEKAAIFMRRRDYQFQITTLITP